MSDRQAQAAAVSNALAQWTTNAIAFDQAHEADKVALAVSNAAYRAANEVAWKLGPDARGLTRQEKIAAEQLAIAAEEAKAKYDAAFQATANAHAAVNEARATLHAAVDALDQDGSVENMGGTVLQGLPK